MWPGYNMAVSSERSSWDHSSVTRSAVGDLRCVGSWPLQKDLDKGWLEGESEYGGSCRRGGRLDLIITEP